MKLTHESQQLLSFFVKHNCLTPQKQTTKTDNILKILFKQITSGVSYINEFKSKNPYTSKIERITNYRQIPKPKTFSPDSIPSEIRRHIDKFTLNLLTYSIQIFNRKISIIFLTEDEPIDNINVVYNKYVDYMLVWLYIVNIYSSITCSVTLNIYIYHTSVVKILPISNTLVLGKTHINTAFTRTCQRDSEIVIFRKEEWFKTFIHETFHNFGLDFSDMDMKIYNTKILQIFKVKSEVKLFEAYTEFWARMINCLFCSYLNMKNKKNVNEFLSNAMIFINFERIFSFFQMVKVLNFMDMTYPNLYDNNPDSTKIRNTMYKEDTNVLSYYIITLILFNNYQSFLSWCYTNNSTDKHNNNNTLLQFNKTPINLDKFCKFIETKYKSKHILDSIRCTEILLTDIKRRSVKKKSLGYLLRNLRMTMCELG